MSEREVINYIKKSFDLYTIQGMALDLEEYVQEEGKVVRTPLEEMRMAFKRINKRVVLERDEYRCTQCGDYKSLHVDHIKPLSKGGTNDLDNLQTLCQTCNLKKGNKLFP